MQLNRRFCSIFKNYRGDMFLAGPDKAYILCVNRSLYVLRILLKETNFCQQHTIVIFWLTHFPLR